MTGLNFGAAAFVPTRPRESHSREEADGPPPQSSGLEQYLCDPDFLDHLAFQFPQYHTQALHDMYEGQGWDPFSTLDLLEQLEREVAESNTSEVGAGARGGWALVHD